MGTELKKANWKARKTKILKANVEGEIMICDNEAIFVLLYVIGSFMKQKTPTNTIMSAMLVCQVALSSPHHIIKVPTGVSKLMSFLFQYRQIYYCFSVFYHRKYRNKVKKKISYFRYLKILSSSKYLLRDCYCA